MGDYALVIEPGYLDHGTEAGLLSEVGVELRRLPVDLDDGSRDEQLAGARILFVRDTRFDARALGKCTSALGLVRYGVGVDGIDLEAARQGRIAVANIPDYGADIEVADHTLALYLAVARRVVTRDAAVRNGTWGVGQAEPVRRIAGQTLGLVGYGRIARAVHRRFAAFGIEEVLVHDPFLPAEAARSSGVTPVDLAELAARSDIVSLHAPGGEPGRPLVDRDFLARMKRDAILVNTARGSHVDERALAEALASGRLSGAGIDVMATEPPAPDNPLLGLKKVVLSDHAGWYSEATVATLQQRAGEEAARIVRGERPLNWVNPW
jgi:D-3-phosphoglycerate dehydrogenase